MRKNSPRKWLHACLDLLPVILIPVFMIYSHRHDVTENVQVNYKYQSNEVNSLDDLVEGNIYTNNFLGIEEVNNFDTFFKVNILSLEGCDYSFDCSLNDFDIYDLLFNNNQLILNVGVSSGNFVYNLAFENEGSFIQIDLFDVEYINFNNITYTITNVVGFKNYINNFKVKYPSYDELPLYTDYNVIESVETTNSNVMSSFMNNFNNTIQTHFNMGNVFNLTGVYDWFNTNIFNGNAPQIIYSVWNIALYELVMDLLFLLYGLFMWFIDMVQHLMDKPFKSIK